MSSENKTVIITGGTKGIGAAIAGVFVVNNYKVIIGARHDNGLDKKFEDEVRFIKADVTQAEDHRMLVKEALDWTGRLDTYINCAGFSGWRSLADIDDEFLSKMLDTNLKGSFWGCQAAARVMERGASIININSLAGKRGSANNSVYCASKFGVTGLTQALAKELGEKGIRVNGVCPVYVPTEGVLAALEEMQSPAGADDVQKYLKDFTEGNTALKRLPTGDDVAQLCLYLASDAASAITGQNIHVDCGVLPS